jgi:hypothetical protein
MAPPHLRLLIDLKINKTKAEKPVNQVILAPFPTRHPPLPVFFNKDFNFLPLFCRLNQKGWACKATN